LISHTFLKCLRIGTVDSNGSWGKDHKEADYYANTHPVTRRLTWLWPPLRPCFYSWQHL